MATVDKVINHDYRAVTSPANWCDTYFLIGLGWLRLAKETKISIVYLSLTDDVKFGIELEQLSISAGDKEMLLIRCPFCCKDTTWEGTCFLNFFID